VGGTVLGVRDISNEGRGRVKRRLFVSALLVGLAVVLVPVAGADPSNAKNSAQLIAVCGSKTVTVVVNGNGEFSPAHDIASTSVFIPTLLDLTITFTPTGGGPPSVDHSIVGKAAPIQNTVSCTLPLQPLFSEPEGSATIQGTVTGFWTPR
jgi:hypothetical protein